MQNSATQHKILIVDDIPVNVALLAAILSKDHNVLSATSGEMALDMAAREQPDLILLDIMMPGMDGHEVCRRLKSSETTKNIPVIFVTAKSSAEDEAYGFDLGAVDYITKPFHIPVVKARVRNHLSLKVKTDLLEEIAHIDGLTNIPNRRRFDETLENEWGRALRSKNPLSLIITDIDYFKGFNDYYGHAGGDQCLYSVAMALSSLMHRSSDMVARYGGEEFVAILPETDLNGAATLAEYWRSVIEAMQIPHAKSGISDYVTVSVGYASTIPSKDQLPYVLLGVADEMLYQAKDSGRNRICGKQMESHLPSSS
ncbi:MAG: diguanylate cyclase [Betaproteobacteria bacterium]|nr:diguanylate cyclase [Betaproteobacteria bacterium]